MRMALFGEARPPCHAWQRSQADIDTLPSDHDLEEQGLTRRETVG